MKHFTKMALVLGLVLISCPSQAQSYIVLFKEAEIQVASLAHGEFQNLLQTSNQKNVEQLKSWIGGQTKQKTDTVSVNDLWLVRGAVANLDADSAKNLAHQPWVEKVLVDEKRTFIQPTGAVQVGNTLADLNVDPASLWGLGQIGLDKIHAEFPQLDGTGVRVGMLDSGVQSKHPEFTDHKIVFKDFVNNIASAYDDLGHGTHTAGTISGETVGIAPKVSIAMAKVFTGKGQGYDSQLLAGMQWMFDPDGNASTDDYPQIVSNSWGASYQADGAVDIEAFAPYHRAIQGWVHGGIIPVFSAGNSGAAPNGMPGGFPETIAVGALNPDGTVADFSSRGPNFWKVGEYVLSLLKPDLSAPGAKIPSAYPGNEYALMDGTSMACPHVTGALALLTQATKGKLKLAQVKNLLMKSSLYKGDLAYGYGTLDAYKLIKLALSTGQR